VATAASWVIVGHAVAIRTGSRAAIPPISGSNAVAGGRALMVSAILPGAKLLSQKRHAKTTEATPALAYNELQSVRGA
jgi:hypothetical protein